MAMSMGMMGGAMGSSSSSAIGGSLGRSGRGLSKGRRGGAGRVRCAAVAGGSLRDQYRVLRLQPGASEKDVKKAFRQLALQRCSIVPSFMRRWCSEIVLIRLISVFSSFFFSSKAFNGIKNLRRVLILQYHPDVCKDSDCSVQFHLITEAYDVIIDTLRQPEDEEEQWQSQGGGQEVYYDDDDQFRGMCDSSWDLWEEWMGWEGAGIRDYSSHVNPYI